MIKSKRLKKVKVKIKALRNTKVKKNIKRENIILNQVIEVVR